MIRNGLGSDFHAVLGNSVSSTLGPGSRGSRLLVVLGMVHMPSLFICRTRVIDWWGLQPLPGLKSAVQGWFHMVSGSFGLPAEGFHRSRNVFQGEKNEMSLG